MTPLELLVVAVGLAIAGLAKGATGMGLPLVATPVLAGVFGPRDAVVIVSIPIFVSNSLLLLQGWKNYRTLSGLRAILVASVVGTAIGVQLLATLDERVFAILITAMVLVFLLRGDRLVGSDPAAIRARVLGPLVGAVGGVLQGTTSIASPLVGSYFHARRLAPGAYVFVLAAIFEVNSVTQIAGYGSLGLFSREILAIALIGLVPTLLALAGGIALRGRLDPRRFRQLIVVLLVLSVANLLWRTFGPA